MYNELTAFNESAKFRRKHTGQVCHLLYVVNYLHDATEKRITIVEPEGLENVTLLRPDDAAQPVVLNADFTDTAAVISSDSAYTGGDVDFIVQIPFSFSAKLENDIKQTINAYKLISKRFTINRYE